MVTYEIYIDKSEIIYDCLNKLDNYISKMIDKDWHIFGLTNEENYIVLLIYRYANRARIWKRTYIWLD